MPQGRTSAPERGRRWPAVLLVILCLSLRIAVWPAYNELRDVDEVPYVQCGLQAWEGMQPSMRHTPNGPQTWLTMAYAAISTAMELGIHSGKPQPTLMRLGHAMDSALFRIYRDSNGLRAVHLVFSALLACVTAIVLYRAGEQRAGLMGGLAVAGWFLLTPAFIQYGGMAHPYAPGWCFALLALAFAANAKRTVASAVCFGLAIACRLEMVALFPILIATLLLVPSARLDAGIGKYVAISCGVFALGAPWFLAGLTGGIRNLVTVGIFRSGNAPDQVTSNLHLIISQGWAGWIFVAVAGVVVALLKYRLRAWPVLLWLIPLAAFAFYQAREVRYSVVWAIGLLPATLMTSEWIGTLRPRAISAIIPLFILLPMLTPAKEALSSIRQNRVADYSADWIEAHVPRGSRIYFLPALRTPFPTVESGARLWEEAAGTDAWKTKFEESGRRYGFDISAVPRAMTLEPLVLEQGNRRRWWLLAGNNATEVARYDLFPNDSIAFGTRNPIEAFQKTGGCLIHRGTALDESTFGKPAYEARAKSGKGVFVYRTAEKPAQ